MRSWTAGRQFRVEDAVERIVGALRRPRPRRRGGARGGLLRGRPARGRPSERRGADCLEALEQDGTRLGIICDIGLTPSPVVAELLARADLLRFFDGMSFSDEVGHYKPDAAIFEHALESVGGVPPERAAHVGDRKRTDVAGALAIGMTAVRYNGVYEDQVEEPEAEIVLADLAELPERLGAGVR